KEPNGWLKEGFNDIQWENASIDDKVNRDLVAQMNQPIRIVKEITPISVNEIKEGQYIFNLGQNIAGWCKLSINKNICEPNTTITLRHGEMLKEDGSLYTKNLRFAKATDKFILKENKMREYHPHFTYHGFQYVEVNGLKPNIDLPLGTIIGCVLASDCETTGSFESSNSKLNKLWKNILWTQRDNMISVPTDCPQRNERMGWMGDAQVFCQTSIYNMDMAAFYTKFIQDIRDGQVKDGRYPDFVPHPYKGRSKRRLFSGVPAWADAGVIIPWQVYLNYNDKRILKVHYNSAKKYVDYIHSKNKNLIWKKSTGNSYNDWLNGDTIKSQDYPESGGSVPKPVFATAYFANSARLVGKMAQVLRKKKDAEKYAKLFEDIRDKFNTEFVKENGMIDGDTQAGYALALNFNLIHDDIRPDVVRNMINALKKYDWRISTGFCTTPMLMKELTKSGYNDIAYQLLLSEKFPSWFYMINNGATTMWERWDGYVKPKPNKSINRIKGSYDSIHGRISVDWKYGDSQFNLRICIPTNTTAKVYLPTVLGKDIDKKDLINIMESKKPLKTNPNIRIQKSKIGKTMLHIESGEYDFSFDLS
ncbi:MAG: Bacterial alpha-L-rhamnosidase, partial [Candidatus Lokiarchaeota archaeon]|nr:Bacterial alpha-L-rhamnosidase [Candidatus Lokiarchaeota archaeon]